MKKILGSTILIILISLSSFSVSAATCSPAYEWQRFTGAEAIEGYGQHKVICKYGDLQKPPVSGKPIKNGESKWGSYHRNSWNPHQSYKATDREKCPYTPVA